MKYSDSKPCKFFVVSMKMDRYSSCDPTRFYTWDFRNLLHERRDNTKVHFPFWFNLLALSSWFICLVIFREPFTYSREHLGLYFGYLEVPWNNSEICWIFNENLIISNSFFLRYGIGNIFRVNWFVVLTRMFLHFWAQNIERN